MFQGRLFSKFRSVMLLLQYS